MRLILFLSKWSFAGDILHRAINLLHNTMKTTPEHDQRMAMTVFAWQLRYPVIIPERKRALLQTSQNRLSLL
jgi:hypothetical protein